jgi:hypothetical protein
MKRVALSFALPVLGLLLGAAKPVSAQGWRGGGHAAPMAHAGGGWRGGFVSRPALVPHVDVASRAFAGRAVYGARPGYGWHAGYGGPRFGYGVGPVAGHWGWRGTTRVWIGAPSVRPYAGWVWLPGTWAWDGAQWAWQDGYWAPPGY